MISKMEIILEIHICVEGFFNELITFVYFKIKFYTAYSCNKLKQKKIVVINLRNNK